MCVHAASRSLDLPPKIIIVLLRYSEAIPDMRQYNVITHIGHGKRVWPQDALCSGTHQPHVLFLGLVKLSGGVVYYNPQESVLFHI